MTTKKRYSYFLAYFSIIVAALGLMLNGMASWIFPVYAFGIIPLLELFLPGSNQNLSKEEEMLVLKEKYFDWMVFFILPFQWGLLVLFLISIQQELAIYELLGKIATFGLACGVFGINVAHELGHRSNKYEQWMSKALLLTSQYMHFFIEHNRGHHKHVSTKKDPATSRYGENVYFFWFRSVFMGYFSAWMLEIRRLAKRKRPWYHWSNEMVWYLFIQVFLLLGILIVFNIFTVFMYFAAAIIGILMLETVNYIEHYGLQRQALPDGTYKNVLPVHSWNSNHPLGRLILFELSRHSDHHYNASRKYQILRHFDESPQLPAGYPGMMLLSLIPPLWFFVMNKRVRNLIERMPDVLLMPVQG
jgi:alkane 1-monooxygenase